MKKIRSISIIVCMVTILFGVMGFYNFAIAAIPVTSGGSYTLEFSSLPFIEVAPGYQDQISIGFNFLGDVFDPGETMRIEFFEDTINSSPFSDGNYPTFPSDITSPMNSYGIGVLNPYSPYWKDLQGITKMTMLSGLVNLDSITVTIYSDNAKYSSNFTVVPEPISSILFITGGSFLAGRRYLRRKA